MGRTRRHRKHRLLSGGERRVLLLASITCLSLGLAIALVPLSKLRENAIESFLMQYIPKGMAREEVFEKAKEIFKDKELFKIAMEAFKDEELFEKAMEVLKDEELFEKAMEAFKDEGLLRKMKEAFEDEESLKKAKEILKDERLLRKAKEVLKDEKTLRKAKEVFKDMDGDEALEKTKEYLKTQK